MIQNRDKEREYLSEKYKKECQAIRFVNSLRGKYIMSQALCIAVKEMSKVKHPHKEMSNIADMEYLIEYLFPIYRIVEKTDKAVKKLKGSVIGK